MEKEHYNFIIMVLSGLFALALWFIRRLVVFYDEKLKEHSSRISETEKELAHLRGEHDVRKCKK